MRKKMKLLEKRKFCNIKTALENEKNSEEVLKKERFEEWRKQL